MNHTERFIVFGAWDRNSTGQGTMILSEQWITNNRGRRNPGYEQSVEHIRLIEEQGYMLKTFPMQYSTARQDEEGIGPATIGTFTPELSDRRLIKLGNAWYAVGDSFASQLPEELDEPERFREGTKRTISVNAFERNTEARKACIQHHGLDCAACGFNFENSYGPLGHKFIHVHHIVPLASLDGEYDIEPEKDLIPLCPNCHAMIHRVSPPLSLGQLKEVLNTNRT